MRCHPAVSSASSTSPCFWRFYSYACFIAVGHVRNSHGCRFCTCRLLAWPILVVCRRKGASSGGSDATTRTSSRSQMHACPGFTLAFGPSIVSSPLPLDQQSRCTPHAHETQWKMEYTSVVVWPWISSLSACMSSSSIRQILASTGQAASAVGHLTLTATPFDPLYNRSIVNSASLFSRLP